MLREQYSNDMKKQERIHKANKIYKYLIYKDKHAQYFEAFSELFRISLDALDNCDRKKIMGTF